ncbi:unnamed protein product [Aureobasidium pullulans]|nr:hypothetical protein D6D23_04749 [Aureobasidium pullulans]CAC9894137.1 unnamed protein product [Aureobasidium pullulans]
MSHHDPFPGQYPQGSWYSAPSVEHWQECPSSMAPPPYPDSHQEHVPLPAESKRIHHAMSHVQLRPTHSRPLYQPRFAIQQYDSYNSSPGVDRPIVIPQIAPGTAPFIRAYSSSLASLGIDISTFLLFLDTLNVALSPTPPLQVLDLAGGIVGMVPHHIPALIGGGLQASAKIAGVVTSKARTKAVLERANKEIFGVQGLKVEIINTETLKRRLAITGPLLYNLGEERSAMSVQQRRLEALGPYTAPLSFDVPLPEQQGNSIDRLSAAQLKRQMAKAEEKALKERLKEGKKADRKAEKGDRRREKDKKRGKKEKQKDKKEDKESKAAEELLWLFIGSV